MARNSLKEGIWKIGCLLMLAAIIWLLCPDSWTDPIKYSLIYGVDRSQVHWNEKPKDCDFIHAPLGDKGCHYKKTVEGFNASGELIVKDAPFDYQGPQASYIEINWVKVSD